MNKVKKFLLNPEIRFGYLSMLGCMNWMSDEIYIRHKFKVLMGYDLDLKDPKTFNEKIQWLKLYDRNPKYTMMVDKYLVRNYVAEKIGGDYLIPLLGVWNDPQEIDFDKLPDQFVLKCNHNSGIGLCICKDKSKLDIKQVRKELRRALRQNYYFLCREWPYKNVPRKIICEKYMVDESGIELKDYKIHNFNGVPRVIQVDYGRFQEHKRNLYTTNWEYINASIKYPTDPTHKIQKPKKLYKMLELASLLSKDIPYVRTDFYSIKDEIYFGELTFHHGGGFEKIIPESFGKRMGKCIPVP